MLLLASLLIPAVNDAAKKTPSEDQASSLKAFLQNYVRNPHYDYKATRYVSAFVKLKADGNRQAIVYFTDQFSCGSGGCSMLVLESQGSSYRVVTSITIVRLPIRVLKTETNGWYDIAVIVAGGGIQVGYEAELAFDGKSYPRNPTVPPARRLVEKVPGEIAISEDMPDKPLFP